MPTIRVYSTFLYVLMFIVGGIAKGAPHTPIQKLGRIDENSLASVVKDPNIQSFDLSADGKIMALLVQSGSHINSQMWLIMAEIRTGRVINQMQIGPAVPPAGLFVVQVQFSGDQQYLVVQDLRQVRVVEAATFQSIRTIESASPQEGRIPLFILGAPTTNIFAVTFGADHQPGYGLHKTPVRVEMVDVATGVHLGGWDSDDVPQSISATGKLVGIADWNAQGTVLGLRILDYTGREIVTLNGGYSFRKTVAGSSPTGRMIGQFLGDDQMILAPDAHMDLSGHQSGDHAELVSLPDGRILTKFGTKKFGPTGEMAISADGRYFVMVNWYAPPAVMRHEWALPKNLRPELLILKRGADIRLENTLQLHAVGLNSNGWMQIRRPHISANGSVLAIAQDHGVTVFALHAND